MRVHFHAVLALGCTLAKAHVMPATRQSAVVEPYVPYTAACPSGSLIRLAKSLNPDEESYVEQRRTKASQALSIWLGQALEGGAKTDDLPTLALALSGGGPKAGLAAAGSIYGLDGREDSASPVAGLLQSMTYISALSGGTLTLSGMIQNDFAKISTLRRDLYQTSYQNVIAAALSNSAQIVSVSIIWMQAGSEKLKACADKWTLAACRRREQVSCWLSNYHCRHVWQSDRIRFHRWSSARRKQRHVVECHWLE